MSEIVGKIDPTIPRKLGDLLVYGLIPTDLPSLRQPNGENSKGGKVGAHGMHAGHMILKYVDHPDVKLYIEDGIANGGDFFNTAITLDCRTAQIDTAIEIAQRLGYVADKVVDKTYPWFVDIETAAFLNDTCEVVWDVRKDGKVLCLRPATTFGWILGAKFDPVFRAIVAPFLLAD